MLKENHSIMKIKIEDYRGWSIEFDTEKESFYCHSEQYDRDETKKSYSSVKKFVDDFIKDNFTFLALKYNQNLLL